MHGLALQRFNNCLLNRISQKSDPSKNKSFLKLYKTKLRSTLEN